MAESKKNGEGELSHAEQNGMGWLGTIKEHVACLDADRERLQELRDEYAAAVETWKEARAEGKGQEEAAQAITAWVKENDAELAELIKAVTIEGDELDADACRERIQESPLSVQVRDGWKSPGAESDGPEEFEILLTTGGPALRIIGELDDHCQPSRARLQHQDWGTPWTDCHFVTSDDEAIILRWASVFYFGD